MTIIIASVVVSTHPTYLKGVTSGDSYSSTSTLSESTISFNGLKQCASPLPPAVEPPAPVNIWASLTVPETTAIQSWLEAPERNLNLTRAMGSRLSDNVIFMIEVYYPPKADALAYLESPTTVPPPDRSARVSIHHGSVPVIRDYLVGPLPIGSSTTIKPLTEIYHRDDIPFHAAGYVTGSELPILISSFAGQYEEVFLVCTSQCMKALSLTSPQCRNSSTVSRKDYQMIHSLLEPLDLSVLMVASDACGSTGSATSRARGCIP